MGFFKRLASLIGGGQSSGRDRFLDIYVRSRRCREPVAGKVDLYNEVSQADSESGYTFYARKVLHTSGANRCFDQVEIEIWFDGKRRPVEHAVTGGEWLTVEEYQEELARFHALPEAEDEPAAEEAAEGDDSTQPDDDSHQQ